MNNPNHPQIIVADKRWKYIAYAVICYSLVFAGFYTFSTGNRSWQFWMAEIVMSAFSIGLTYMLVSGKYRFVDRDSPEYVEFLETQYADFLNETGQFEYFDGGFIFHSDTEKIQIMWSDIERISGHIEDNLTNSDDLCLRIEYKGNHFIEFDEECPGWLLFREKMREQFPSISWEWQNEVLNSNIKEIELYKANPSA